MRAIEHRHFVQGDAFFVQLQDALSDKKRLLRGVFTYNERGAIAGFAGWRGVRPCRRR